MRRVFLLSSKIIGIVGLALTPLAIHLAIVTSNRTPVVVVISGIPLAILGIATAFRHPKRIKWLVIPGAALVLALVWAQQSYLSLAAVTGIPHAIAYSALLFAFGRSLLYCREPILTKIVIAVRGPLPSKLIAHTRRMTWAWCHFFAGQLIVSTALFVWAPIEAWSFFVNVLNLPLILIMIGGECGYRLVRFRDHDSVSDFLRVVAMTTKRGSHQVDLM